MKILNSEKSAVRAVCGVWLDGRKRAGDLMLMMSLNEVTDQLVMASSVHWCVHVLRMEDGNVLRR